MITVLEHGVGYAHFDRSARFGNVACGFTAVALLEEVDTPRAAVTAAAVQTQRVDTKRIDTHAHGALSKARGECAQEALAPFGFILLMVFIVAADIRVTRQHVQMTVFDKTFCISLIVGHGLGRTKHTQCKQTYPFVQHFIFLITE